MLGTIVNSIAVIVGCLVGLVVKGRLNEKISITVMQGLALCTLYIGISGALKGENTLIMILSVAIGALIGEIIDIDKRLNNLGEYLESKFNGKKESNVSIAEGFVSASLLFCVGAMAIVGSLESGLSGNHNTLFTKSILDGISSIIFTSSLGIGVIFSSVAVFIYQGGITLGAGLLSGILNDMVIANMSAVGGLLIAGLAFNMLGVTKMRIANLLPAIFLPIIFQIFIR
ncbi:DUF554 domain-containing protein [Clostridium celatum]|uniref:DUF554 domain-containing protein n=1 Tax=Clostridium celatum TaxID=36834 RepID=UPI00189C0CCA|nr:DUF554 domain-containing protein [Clostridium celatum]MDU2265929.1 DUF554 domain-containing protein [Clostridium celatum]MDU6296233.1 DUF554 domain-containing protein [Clostridium celatum]MDY3362267.1 DUF554 domain-containing protein [Clostridium celatum]